MMPPTSKNTSNDNDDNMQCEIKSERIRQARGAFNLAWGATALSVFVGLCGAVLLFNGNVSTGVATTATGAVCATATHKLAKDANDRLDRLIK